MNDDIDDGPEIEMTFTSSGTEYWPLKPAPKVGLMLRPYSRRTGRNVVWEVRPPRPPAKRPPLPPLPPDEGKG